jgi:hypothetical protein
MWTSPPTSDNNMGPKEWFEFMKMMEEYQKAQKPKEDKKPGPSPTDWGPFDYFLLYSTIHTAGALMLATFIVYYVTHLTH